jgi:hypothetical protein
MLAAIARGFFGRELKLAKRSKGSPSEPALLSLAASGMDCAEVSGGEIHAVQGRGPGLASN